MIHLIVGQPQTDLDEQFARRLMLEEQEQGRHRGPVVFDYGRQPQPDGAPSGRDTMTEFQEQFNKFAESMSMICFCDPVPVE
jgi:hypothetical protein